MVTAGVQPFIGHIHELRRRLTWSVFVLLLGGAAGYYGRNQVINWLQKPFGRPLYYNSPSGGFEFVMQICLFVGVLIALPVLIYNLIRFIEPAFKKRRLKGRSALIIVLTSCALAVAGCAFGYYLILPMAFHFFAGFNTGPVKPLVSTGEYMSFVLACLITFALIFQLPLILLFINTIHKLPPGTLNKYQRHVIVGSFALALVLPFTYDPITQFLMAVPIIAVYEISIVLLWLTNRNTIYPVKAEEPQLLPESVAQAPPISIANKSLRRMDVARSSHPNLLDLRKR